MADMGTSPTLRCKSGFSNTAFQCKVASDSRRCVITRAKPKPKPKLPKPRRPARPARSKASGRDQARAGVALSRERIAAVALALVDREGLAALSTRRLGDELGCEAMSIYHHFPNKAHLMDALVDLMI